MRKFIFFTGFMLFMVTQLAQSQSKILVQTGNKYTEIGWGTPISDCYSLLGYETTEISDDAVKLSDLSDYQLAVLVFPANGYDAAEVAQLSALLERGGRIFCISDKAENFSMENGYLNELIQALGGSSTYLNESCGYGSHEYVLYPETNYSSTIDLFQDVQIMHTAVFSPISLGGNARELVRVYKKVTYGDSRIMMAQESVGNGDIVMCGDVNINYSGAVMDDPSSSICHFYTNLVELPPYVGSELTTVTTSPVSNVGTTSIMASADLSDLGSPDPTQHGFCWSTETMPAVDDAADDNVELGALSETGTFSYSVTGLTPNTSYYVRAYATNDAGTTYGEQVSFTTLKQPQTITFDELTAKTYGDVPFDLEATASSGLSVTYASSNTAVATISGSAVIIHGAGTTTITASQAGGGSYEAAEDVEQTLTIQKIPITVTADAGQTKIFASEDPELTYSASPSLRSGDSYSGDLTRVAGENAGAYAINQGTLTAGANYDLTFVSRDMTITPKPITVTAIAGQKKVYGTVDAGFGYIPDPSLESGDAFTGSLTREPGEDVGLYAILQGEFTAGDNYEITFVSADFEITPKAITVTADAGQTKVYGSTDPVFTYSFEPALEGDDEFSGTLQRADGKDVGKYAITQGSLTAGANYDLTFVSKDFSITSKPITVKPDAGQSKIYGDLDPEAFTYTVTPSLVEGDTFTGALDREPGEGTTISYYIRLATLTAGDNYDITYEFEQFSITNKPITVIADEGKSKVCGSSDPVFTYTVTPPLVDGDSFDGALSREAGEDVGTYSLTQGSLTMRNNYDITFVSHDFEITPKPITVTAQSGLSKDYGSDDPEFTYTISPYLVSGTTTTGALSREAGKDVGAYAITLGDLSFGDNHTVTFVSADFEIEPRRVYVVPVNGQSKNYGDPDPEITYTVNPPLEEGDSFSGSLSRNPGEDVGGYYILPGDLTAGDNYEMRFTDYRGFNITKKPITVTADPGQSKIFSYPDPEFTYSVDPPLVGDDVFNGSLSRSYLDGVGTCAITIGSLDAGSNYEMTFVSNDFEIVPLDVTVTVDPGQSKVYGDSDPRLTYSVNPESVTLSGSPGREAGQDVGTYATTQGTLSGFGLYNITMVPSEFEIKPATITIRADSKYKVYGDEDPELTFSNYSGLKYDDVYSGSLGREAGENAGTYSINQGTLSVGDNYIMKFTSKDFVIAKKEITVEPDSYQKKAYGDPDPVLTYSVNPGLISGDVLDGELSRATGEKLSRYYSISQGTLNGGDNYDITFKSGVYFEIYRKAITVTADPGQTKVYGAEDPEWTYTFSPELKAGDSFTGGLRRVYGNDVGSYALNYGTLSAGNNYTITFVSADMIITKAPQTITFEALSPVLVGDGDFDLTATIDSWLDISFTSSDPAVATIDGNTVHVVGAGTATITASQAGDDNHLAAEEVQQELVVQVVSAIGEQKAEVISFYPNPARNQIFFNKQVLEVAVYNLTGTKVLEQKVANGSLDITTLVSGVYFIRVGDKMLKMIVRK